MPYVGCYVAAHQDDWQLFRGEQAWADLNTAGVRVVFVHTTAGDAGATNGWWEARVGAVGLPQLRHNPSVRLGRRLRLAGNGNGRE